MELYNKAIVYYSALSDEKHLEYLQKLQRLFSDDRIQKILQSQGEEAKRKEESPKKNPFVEQVQKDDEEEKEHEPGLLEEDS